MTSSSSQKIKIIVDDQPYSVEIIETSEVTLEVTVDGQSYQVQIQPENQHELNLGAGASVKPTKKAHRAPVADTPEIQTGDLTAPLPGHISEIFVKVGDHVETGQELCVIEAMKMKNVLRSPRSGKVTAIDVSLGETVPYNKILIRFA